jgi:hypothetical protein
MASLPKHKLSQLKEKIGRQKLTVAALKREGHVYTDAERQLRSMKAELRQSEPSQKAP